MANFPQSDNFSFRETHMIRQFQLIYRNIASLREPARNPNYKEKAMKQTEHRVRKANYRSHRKIFGALSVNSQLDSRREVSPHLYQMRPQMMNCKQQGLEKIYQSRKAESNLNQSKDQLQNCWDTERNFADADAGCGGRSSDSGSGCLNRNLISPILIIFCFCFKKY